MIIAIFNKIKKNNNRRVTHSNAPWGVVLHRLLSDKVAVISFAVFAAICLSCAMAPLLTKWDYSYIDINRMMLGFSKEHLLGTDNLGRDMLARLLFGGRLTLRIALVSTVIAAVFGCSIGLLAGFYGGRVDLFISPAIDTVASIPVILLALLIEAVLGWGHGYFIYAIAIAAIPQFTRLVRASVMNIMGCEYIEAARALGMSSIGILLRHVLHNTAPPLIVRFASGFAEALLTCTVMGYLGIGVNPPTPEWGVIVFLAKSYILVRPRLIVIPCLVITICVVTVSLFGDGLRDALDPRK